MATSTDPILQLSYATPVTSPRSGLRLRHALSCGLIPLLTGISATVGATVTGHVIFGLLGLTTLGFGLLFFLVGTLYLISYVREQRALFGRLDDAARVRVILVLLVLLSNFPAAAICLSVGGKALSLDSQRF